MIKTLAWFPFQCARNSRPIIDALLTSARDSGIEIVENTMQADAAVIWSVLWSGAMRNNQEVYTTYRSTGRNVIVVDVGCLMRNVTWKIALNNVNALGIYGHEKNIDLYRAARMGLILGQPSRKGDQVLLAAQHQRSLQLADMPSQEFWINQQIKKIRDYSDRPIVVRPHPRSPLRRDQIDKDVIWQTPLRINNTYDDFNMDYCYHAVVNYCSGPGIQAAIYGCRPVVSEASLAWPVAVSYENIEKQYDIDREMWFNQILHTEYFADEIKQGLWLKRLRDWL